MTYTDTPKSLTIEGIEEPAVANYFITINQEKFAEAAALFAEEGELNAPFAKPIVGKKAIATYLAQEAQGMKLLPKQGTCQTIEDNIKQVKVIGKVQTPLFSVNVAWYFNLNQTSEITSATIKLLASPQELLGLKQAKGDR